MTAVAREVRIHARPDTIFPFFTDPELMVHWMGTSAEVDPGPAASTASNVRTAFTSPAASSSRSRRRTASSSPGAGSPDDTVVPPGASTVEVTLVPDGDHTIVRLVHSDLPSELGQRPRHRMGPLPTAGSDRGRRRRRRRRPLGDGRGRARLIAHQRKAATMATYVLAYKGGRMPETDAERDAQMAASRGWFQNLGAAVVDAGNPFGPSKAVAGDGTISEGATLGPDRLHDPHVGQPRRGGRAGEGLPDPHQRRQPGGLRDLRGDVAAGRRASRGGRPTPARPEGAYPTMFTARAATSSTVTADAADSTSISASPSG